MDGAGTTQGTGRRVVRVTGTVQGVGFRPFVYRHAVALGLKGFVQNDSAGVLIDVEGSVDALDELCRLVSSDPPPLARVESVDTRVLEYIADRGDFRIVESEGDGDPAVPVGVDTATCGTCLAEVDDPADRRFRYPFTNCTDCGPRYTIVISVPYDRGATTMAGFVMCERCQAEYDDPSSRRFHAQPNACPECGPQLLWHEPSGGEMLRGEEALNRGVEALLAGRVVAVKGVGGFHLAVDATSEEAVNELRRRKSRDDKPFALMVPDLQQAKLLCDLDPASESELGSFRRPILLAPRRDGAGIASGVAPGMPELGLVLAYTPLHHLVTRAVGRPLVMTSGNLSDDPIAFEDDDATQRLGPLVDGFLTHDRPVHVRCDDSVVRSTTKGVQMVRRSRGYSPEPMRLPAPGLRQVLAVGAELKNTVSVTKGRSLITSHHIGDLEHLSTYQSFLQATRRMCDLFGVEPDVVAHDMHPEYLSTKWALECGLETWEVQHHHAHVASCLAEHASTGPVLGIAFDGLGFGPDGTLWGGEMLVADLVGYRRVGHLLPVRMPGGTAAIREPWRMAMAWVASSAGVDEAQRLGSAWDARSEGVLGLIEREAGAVTTGAGRLFDAVAAILGLRSTITYEGQAAIELEALARSVETSAAPVYALGSHETGGLSVLDPRPMLVAILEEVRRGRAPALVAAGFHAGLGAATASLAAKLAERHDLDTVALTGGVFQNSRLTEIVVRDLESSGLRVLVHRHVPPNDGGISVGQAAVAATSHRG